MRYYLLSTLVLFTTVFFILLTADASNSIEDIPVTFQIPQNNSQVAGVEKYNLPPVGDNLTLPELSARAMLIKDLQTDTILYQKNIHTRLPIASTTKIMTALVANEYYQPNSVLEVMNASNTTGATVGLVKGERLSFRALLYGMLLSSGNDAAYTIAENFPGGVAGFVEAMNQKSRELNLNNSHFDNPAGFDSPNHFSSALDLAKITQEAIKDGQLSRIFATKDTEVVSQDKRYTHKLSNLNKLLGAVGGVLGVKTGYTENAKENLVTLVERDGHKVLIVLLGSDDRFGETTKVIDWVYSNFVWPPSR